MDASNHATDWQQSSNADAKIPRSNSFSSEKPNNPFGEHFRSRSSQQKTNTSSPPAFHSRESNFSHPLESPSSPAGSDRNEDVNSGSDYPWPLLDQNRGDSIRNLIHGKEEIPMGKDCTCQCVCGNTSELMQLSRYSAGKNDTLAVKDLSWRLLHMSRAKLKGSASTSDILAGFAMVALVEIQFQMPTETPEWLFILFSISTTVLVSIHIIALMISTYILPNIEAICKLHVRGMVVEAPHERLRAFIEISWSFSTIFGLFLFLINVNILCWIKFWDTSITAAWGATFIVIPALIMFAVFVVYFYHTIVVYKVKAATADMQELERARVNLDNMKFSTP